MTRRRGEPRERCTCGQWPRFSARQVSEDCVSSSFDCRCGKFGPEVEDAYSDRGTAASSWDAMRRQEQRA